MSNKLCKRECRRWVADFETTVNTEITEVWSAASIDLDAKCHPDNVKIQTSIEDFFEFIFSHRCDLDIYFHNLKFDGSFIMSWLLEQKEFRPYQRYLLDGKKLRHMDKEFRTCSNAFTYLVSDMGLWYEISVAHNGHIYTFKDSLKLLPFTVEQIGKAFETKYKKLEMEYEGDMHAGGTITKEQMAYIKNDVLVMHEAMNIMISRGLDKATIGACCMSEYKEMEFMFREEYREKYPDLYEVKCPFEGFKNADEYIRKSYHGGWCYVKPEKANKLFGKGITCDVNSLYPSMMHSDSGNAYPYGKPHWFTEDIPEICEREDIYYFVRIKTRFELKEGYLPTLQIKGSGYYKSNEWLTTSDYIDKEGKRHKYAVNLDGQLEEIRPELVLTQTDYKLLVEHYDLTDTEILDGCYFDCEMGPFDNYINYWAEKKINAPNKTEKQISKLMLNNLYGKTASSNESSYKVFYLDENKIMKAAIVKEYEKQPGYIAVGSAITSYARNFTITAAQANYEHFIYADTDSIHCDCEASEIVGCPKHPTAFNHWAYESTWDSAIFVRQKTYIEHVIAEDEEPIDKPYYNIKCAGMGKTPKAHLAEMLESGEKQLTDFKVGLKLKDNLKARMVQGGTVLMVNEYVMR